MTIAYSKAQTIPVRSQIVCKDLTSNFYCLVIVIPLFISKKLGYR